MVRLRSRTVVGRAAELAVVEDALAQAADGDPATLLICGDAGAGKTRLLDEAVARAEDAGFLTLCGAAVALDGGGAPLLPLVDAFDGLALRVEAPTWDTVRDLGTGSAGWLLGLPGPAVADDGSDRTRLLAVVAQVLRRLASERPVLLTVDDAQWADGSTRDVLAFAVRALRRERVVVLVTVRAEALVADDRLRSWSAELDRAPTARRIDLGPLDDAAVGAQLADILGREPPPDVVRRVSARSGGNPFFVEELATVADGDLPPTVRDVLAGRLVGLDDEAALVTRAAAAAGRSSDPRLLRAVTGLDREAFDAALARAARHAVLAPGDHRAVFRHDLFREVVEEATGPGEHERLHGAVADALDARPELAGGGVDAALAEIAAHRRQAGDDARAREATLAAAHDAMDRRAFRTALEEFEAAIALGARDHAVLGAAAHAAGMCVEHRRAVELFDLAVEAAPDAVAEGKLRAWRGLYYTNIGRSRDARAELLRAARLIPRDTSRARARTLANLAFGRVFEERWEDAVVIAAEALRVARLSQAATAESLVWNTLGLALGRAGRFEDAFVRFERAIAAGAKGGAPDTEVIAINNLGDALYRAGRWADAHRVFQRSATRAEELGISDWEVAEWAGAAWALIPLGRWDEADELLRRGLALELTDANALMFAHPAAELALGRGQLDPAEAHLAGAEALRDFEMGVEPAVEGRRLRADLLRRRGDLEGALQLARDGLRIAVTGPDLHPAAATHADGIALAAELATVARARRDAAGERRALLAAQELDAVFAALRDRWPAASDLIAAHELQAAAERARLTGGDAAAAWAAAQQAWAALGGVPRENEARLRHAEALLAAGAGRDDAAALLAPAHAWARQAGAEPLRREIEALAARARLDIAGGTARAAAGARDGVPDTASAYGLTERELEVLAHLAAGRTNRQIADALFISVKTAGTHVVRVMGKLGVHTRGEAGAVARRAGLVDDETLERHLTSLP